MFGPPALEVSYSGSHESCHPLSYELASCQSLVQSSQSESKSGSVATSFLNILASSRKEPVAASSDPLRQSEVLLQSLYQRITGPSVQLNLSRGQLHHSSSKLSAKRRDQLLGVKR